MEPEIRELTDDDREINHRLGAEAFGYPPDRQPAALPPAGGRVLGALIDGVPVAKIRLHDYRMHLPGGRHLPVSGVASVAVQPEWRGRGLLTPLFRTGLAHTIASGQAVSFLFPTAAGIYRRFGYEVVGTLEQRELAVGDLTKVRAPEGISLRRATASDIDALRALYAEWASDRLGPLTRTGPAAPMFTPDYVADPAAVTLAVNPGDRIVGSLRWTRGTGYDPTTSTLEVEDLIGVTPEAIRALWRFLGTFGSVSGRVNVELPAGDESLTALPVEPAPAARAHRCMIAVLDVVAALNARRGVPGLSGTLPFRVEGGFADGVDGDYELHVDGAGLRCARVTSSNGPVFTARGLAALYGGALRCAALRASGMLHGDTREDPVWDALFNVPLQIRDYF